MVDNAIVIIEGVNEYVSKYKKNAYEAALLSVWNFKWAISSGTLTTVSAFAPMLLVSGILGQYMSTLPKTITVTLLSSLFVALIIIGYLFPISIFSNPDQLREYVQGFGIYAPVAFVVLNILQVVVTPISWPVVSQAGGFIFGLWFGFFLNDLKSPVYNFSSSFFFAGPHNIVDEFLQFLRIVNEIRPHCIAIFYFSSHKKLKLLPGILSGLFISVKRPALLTFFNSLRVQDPAHDVISDSNQVLHPSSAE